MLHLKRYVTLHKTIVTNFSTCLLFLYYLCSRLKNHYLLTFFKMKKIFTIIALALMVMGAKAEDVYKIDYSTYTGFPFYVMGYVPEWINGVMTDFGSDYRYETLENLNGTSDTKWKDGESSVGTVTTNNGTEYQKVTGAGTYWHQYFIADGIPTVEGNDYVVKALVRASADVTIIVNMGWGWGANEKIATSVEIPKSTEFVEVEWEYKNIGGTNCNLVAQPGTIAATIEWKELTVSLPSTAESSVVYGDLHEVTPSLFVKENNGSTVPAVADGDGVITINNDLTDGDDWKTQFWIGTPEKGLPAGQKFYVEFNYKADAKAKVGTQTHVINPGGYKHWTCIGEVEFDTDWKTFSKEVTISGEMDGWQYIAFNLNLNEKNNYYIKDIVLKVPEYKGEIVEFTVGSAGWATFSCAKNISLGTVKGYKAKYNGSYVELTAVTEVPAGNAVILEGAGKHTFDVIDAAAAITDNDLLVSDGTATSDGHFFALKQNGDKVGFYKVKEGVKIPAGKAYLNIPTLSRDFVGFGLDGETTGVNDVRSKMEEVRGDFYNLNGQRVSQPTKGLYIVNGKKVVIK